MSEFDKSRRPKVGLGVIVTSSNHPGCILLGKRRAEIGCGQFALPGGHLEYGESWEECAIRETLEETGLKLTNIQQCTVLNVIDLQADYHYIEIFMQAEVDNNHKTEPENPEPDKCDGWVWCSWDKLPPRNQLFCGFIELLDTGYQPFVSHKSS